MNAMRIDGKLNINKCNSFKGTGAKRKKEARFNGIFCTLTSYGGTQKFAKDRHLLKTRKR